MRRTATALVSQKSRHVYESPGGPYLPFKVVSPSEMVLLCPDNTPMDSYWEKTLLAAKSSKDRLSTPGRLEALASFRPPLKAFSQTPPLQVSRPPQKKESPEK